MTRTGGDPTCLPVGADSATCQELRTFLRCRAAAPRLLLADHLCHRPNTQQPPADACCLLPLVARTLGWRALTDLRELLPELIPLMLQPGQLLLQNRHLALQQLDEADLALL